MANHPEHKNFADAMECYKKPGLEFSDDLTHVRTHMSQYQPNFSESAEYI